MKRIKRLLGLLLSIAVFVGVPLAANAAESGKLIIWADDTRTPIFREIGEAYTEAVGVPVEVVEMAMDDIREQSIIAAPAGEGPDIIVGAHDWIGKLVLNGIIAELELPKDVLDQFDPVTLEGMSYGGKLYGVPYAREGVALLYNKSLVPEPPATWDELIQIARELTDPTVPQYGFIVEYPFPYNCFPILSALGGYVFGKTPEGGLNIYDIGLDTTGMILGAELIDWLIEEGLMPAEVPWETMTSLLSEGRVGMVITGPWSISIAKGGGIDVGVAPIPLIAGQHPRPFVGVPGVMVSAYSPNMAIVRDFLLNHFITKDIQLLMYNRDPRIPAYLPAYKEVADDPILRGFAESLKYGLPMANIPEMSAVWAVWADAMELIGNQKLEPSEALRQAAEQIRETLRRK